MEQNGMPTETRPSTPPSGTSGPPPGSQHSRGNTAKAAMELTMMLGQELIASGKAILTRDPRAWAISQAKLRQIQQAAVSIGGQKPANAAPQGSRTGVPTPAGRPIDPITRRA